MDPRHRSAEAEAKDSQLEILVRAVQPYGLSLDRTRLLVQQTFQLIGDEVVSTGRFAVPRFGVFTLRKRKARTVRNPATKELMQLPETRTIHFRPGKALRGVL